MRSPRDLVTTTQCRDALTLKVARPNDVPPMSVTSALLCNSHGNALETSPYYLNTDSYNEEGALKVAGEAKLGVRGTERL